MKLLGISGSLRAGSMNTRLLKEAARLAALEGEASFTLANIHFPLYDGDLEEKDGVPKEVTALADAIDAANAIMISTPEYNKGMSGVLKNALDWLSRTKRSPLSDKPVAIMSSAAGRAGGERAQAMLRQALVAFRPRIIAQAPEIHVGQHDQAYGEEGQLSSEWYIKDISAMMATLRAETKQ